MICGLSHNNQIGITMSEEKQSGHAMSAAEIVMMQTEVIELKNRIVMLEQLNFLLRDKNKKLLWTLESQD